VSERLRRAHAGGWSPPVGVQGDSAPEIFFFGPTYFRDDILPGPTYFRDHMILGGFSAHGFFRWFSIFG
jgi:hypothetical protein